MLPGVAGAGGLRLWLGGEVGGVSAVIVLSTVMPLWAFAKLSQHWLKSTDDKEDEHAIS